MYDYLLIFVPLNVTINGPNDVINEYREHFDAKGKKKETIPLFLIDLVKT